MTITVSLEWAKKLKEAGWPQDSFLYWFHLEGLNSLTSEKIEASAIEYIAAPTAEEILRRLPRVSLSGDECYLQAERIIKETWNVEYEGTDGISRSEGFADESLANAAAAMWCYLSDNNLLP